ncbi:hypothetical protein GCM10027053_33820 [Intrasporangium mesophilum]
MAAGHPGPSPSDGHSTAEGLAQAASALLDAMLGLVVVAADQARIARLTLRSVAAPLTPLLELPLGLTRGVVQGVAGQRWATDLVETGTMWRWQSTDRLRLLAFHVAPIVVDRALRLVDLTDIVRSNVDLNAIVEDVDIDAIVGRVDIESIVDGLDIDEIVSRVDIGAIVDRLDIGAIVDRLDIDAIVARVDLDAIVDRLDIGAIVDRLDLDAIVDRLDIDAIVARVDIGAIVDRLDIDAIIAKIDLIEIAEFIVEGIDLPGIIRSSTGSMASEGIREVRRQGISADERVAHIVDRLLRRPNRAPGSVNHVPLLVTAEPIPAAIAAPGPNGADVSAVAPASPAPPASPASGPAEPAPAESGSAESDRTDSGTPPATG